jgi:2-octaprenyl-6-methoxyphenol hydroxylase
VECELAHDNIAYERFTPAGPVALLPNGKAFSLVWTATPEIAQQLCDLDEAEFLQCLHGHFGDRLGCFLSVGKRITFPLKLSYLSQVTSPRLVVIGNAAQTMHPVAGQGFNIGLRDAWELADMVGSTTPEKIGGDAMLKNYQQGRQADTNGGILFTDFLVRLFSNDIGGLSALRAAGLGLLDLVPPAKRLLIGKMSFGAHG